MDQASLDAQAQHSPMRRAAALASLIVAGESVFVPPFYLGRFFKSSMMETLSINELDLGQLGAIYGAVAMVCYAVGGPIADRFSPRTLIASSLIVTGCGSLYLATFPSLTGLRCLYAFWGASTILLFWAPLVRATREWGGEQSQGRAFGLLDGGRGLYAALVATVAAYAFGAMMAGEGASEADAVRKILYGFALCCAAAALAVWVCVPSSKPKRIEKEEAQPEGGAVRSVARDLLTVLSMRSIWLTVMVVFSAYCAFKMFDFYGLYLEDSAGYTKSQSARTVAYLSYLRVASALAAGWIADKWLGPARTTTACFALLIASYVLLISAPGDNAPVALAIGTFAVTCIAFFGLRGVYFAIFEEEGTPRELTGAAVGVVSLVGFTPEIVMPPLIGWLIHSARESDDVLLGYQRVFVILAVLMTLGLAASIMLARGNRRVA